MILFSIFFALFQAKELIDSPCFTDFRTEINKNIGKSGIVGKKTYIEKECFSRVPDIQKNVMAYTSQSSCYLPRHLFTRSFKNQTYTRCGLCLEITGPSLLTTTCTVVGSTYMNATTPFEKDSYSRTIFVDEHLFEYLSGFEPNISENMAIPIVARLTSCILKTFPAVVISNIIKNSPTKHTAEVCVFNGNAILQKIQIMGNAYKQDLTSLLFNIPFNPQTDLNKTHEMKIFDYLGQSVLLNFKFELQTIQSTQTHFGDLIKSTKCYLRPEEMIISDHFTSSDPYFQWTVRVHNPKNFSDFFELNKTNPTFSFFNETLVSITFPFPLKISHHYTVLFQQYTMDHPFTKTPTLKVMYFIDDITNAKEVHCINDFERETTIKHINEKVQYSTKTGIKIAKCNGYVNVAAGYFITDVQTEMTIDSMYFTPFSTLNYTKCPTSSYYCQPTDECDPTNSTIDSVDGKVITYPEGCHPYCGTCLRGFKCNKAARCVKPLSKNTRSSSNRIMVVMIATLLLLIF
ncbi:hypothetical protein ENUP19_0388G0009 [Entamoeba nuttalli]|uniref:Uncharacterized protein n=1 Tax=Entamoeba nuttalli TaxID=412467 RepID=A0ABQ0DZL1_9EUKA